MEDTDYYYKITRDRFYKGENLTKYTANMCKLCGSQQGERECGNSSDKRHK